jgi:hypothetical protein
VRAESSGRLLREHTFADQKRWYIQEIEAKLRNWRASLTELRKRNEGWKQTHVFQDGKFQPRKPGSSCGSCRKGIQSSSGRGFASSFARVASTRCGIRRASFERHWDRFSGTGAQWRVRQHRGKAGADEGAAVGAKRTPPSFRCHWHNRFSDILRLFLSRKST